MKTKERICRKNIQNNYNNVIIIIRRRRLISYEFL